MHKIKVYLNISMVVFIIFLTFLLVGCLDESDYSNGVGKYSLNININGEGEVIKSPSKDLYNEKEEVELKAQSNSGYSFFCWEGGLSEDKNPVKLVMNQDTEILALFTEDSSNSEDPTIYGDKGPAELTRDLLIQDYNYDYKGNAFGHFFDRKDKGIFVHITEDSLSNELSQKLYDMDIDKLDEITEEEGIFYQRKFIDNRPVFLVSAKNKEKLENTYENDNTFHESIDKIIKAKYDSDDSDSEPEEPPTEDIVWESSGHEPKVFKGLFTNPDYSNRSAFLEEDGITEITPQVEKVATMINDNRDLSTLEEIYNLLKAISTDSSPENTFEVSASEILSTPITGGCTTYATAFATLARAKGIPSVVIDSAKLEWIKDSCSLNYVQGHFFVEVYLKGEWLLVDSTSGKLYENYDRKNWFLPDNYIAFYKALSVIDPGVTEGSHNLLQRVAFVKKDNIDYINPKYHEKDLFDDALKEQMEKDYNKLDIEIDNDYSIDTSGEKFEIEASSDSIDYQSIPLSK
ncbi:MAG: transglutaminase domain-containing protein [bacterium]